MGQIKIDIAIVVEVCGRRPHPVATGLDPTRFGHINEVDPRLTCRVFPQVISKEPATGRRLNSARKSCLPRVSRDRSSSLHAVQVEVAVPS